MIEAEIIDLIEESERKRRVYHNGFYYDSFPELSNFLNNINEETAPVIVDNFDRILPFIVFYNLNFLTNNMGILIKQKGFKEKFAEGIINYPYLMFIGEIVGETIKGLNQESYDINDFFNGNVLESFATLDLQRSFYSYLLNKLNEGTQKEFLDILVAKKCDIPYSSIGLKSSNRKYIFDNLELFIANAKNLYQLLSFVKDDSKSCARVKEYIDSHDEHAIDSLFYELGITKFLSNPTIKDIVRLIILDVKNNEKAKLSEISRNRGAFSNVILIGDKVIKVGKRKTKNFPNNPYIVTPLLRKDFNIDGCNCFIEVTERVNTSEKVSIKELYQLYKNLRNLGLIWTDVGKSNVGRLRKENIIHWKRTLSPSDETLELKPRVGDVILKEGDLVVLDADYIFEEGDPNLVCGRDANICDIFDKIYKAEKELALSGKQNNINFDDLIETEEIEPTPTNP